MHSPDFSIVDGAHCFSPEFLAAVSPETQKNLKLFEKSIPHASDFLAKYHTKFDARLRERQPTNGFENIRYNARLAITMSWSKVVLFSRSIVDGSNTGNQLTVFLVTRAYVELVASLRFTVGEMRPIIEKWGADDCVPAEDLERLAYRLHLILYGGRFDWQTYFLEGAKTVMDRKQVKKTKEERKKFDTLHLRIGACVESWSAEAPEAGFIYDFLCDLVHPNKGSNLVLLQERDGSAVFSADGPTSMGMQIFERIMPYALSLCGRGIGEITPFLAMLAATEREA